MRVITEGHIQAGDAIVKTRTGPGALSVADTDALLYLPGPEQDKLRTAVRIPAPTPAGSSVPGHAVPAGRRPQPRPGPGSGAAGNQGHREDATVRSIYLAAADGSPLPPRGRGST